VITQRLTLEDIRHALQYVEEKMDRAEIPIFLVGEEQR